jgi:hypothetical protein
MGTSSMTKASKPTPKQNHPDQLDLIDYINAKEAEEAGHGYNIHSEFVAPIDVTHITHKKEAREAFLACHHHEITHIIAAHKFVSVRTNTTKGE